MTAAPLLTVSDLSVTFRQGVREIVAVDRISFDIKKGETVALVGESGSGKSVTALSIMKLLPYPAARHPSGAIMFKGQELLGLPERGMRRVRGNDITIIFQEPTTSLNPLHTIEKQIGEILLLHRGMTGHNARARIVELLGEVGIPDPASRLGSYPHQLSGGQRQRVMIAMALANEPDLLIADEPTTALDVTIQAQILDLLVALQRERGMALVLITHDMGVVAETAQRIMVMYASQQVEEQVAEQLFAQPRHPYTAALLEALPERSIGTRRLKTIEGVVPGIADRPVGCVFNPRCGFATDRCRAEQPKLAGRDGWLVRCHYPLNDGRPLGHPGPPKEAAAQ
jgi:dipeptide transport system ATP-binding protein